MFGQSNDNIWKCKNNESPFEELEGTETENASGISAVTMSEMKIFAMMMTMTVEFRKKINLVSCTEENFQAAEWSLTRQELTFIALCICYIALNNLIFGPLKRWIMNTNM